MTDIFEIKLHTLDTLQLSFGFFGFFVTIFVFFLHFLPLDNFWYVFHNCAETLREKCDTLHNFVMLVCYLNILQRTNIVIETSQCIEDFVTGVRKLHIIQLPLQFVQVFSPSDDEYG